MLKWKYIFLTVSLIELAIGLSNAAQNTFFYLGLPVGAILFGLFLVAQVLEKESALYDEQNGAMGTLCRVSAQPETATKFQEVAHHPAHTMAHTH